MDAIDWVYGILSLVLLAAFAVAAYVIPRPGTLVSFASALPVPLQNLSDQAQKAFRELLLQQYKVAFWAMIGSGLTALAILAFALFKAVIFPPPDTKAWSTVIGVITGLGNSALFVYFVNTWNKCYKNMKPYFPLPPSEQSSAPR